MRIERIMKGTCVHSAKIYLKKKKKKWALQIGTHISFTHHFRKFLETCAGKFASEHRNQFYIKSFEFEMTSIFP